MWWTTAVAGEPGLEKVASDETQGTLRYVQRSRLMRYPDTINVKVVALPDGGSTVLIYSRSQLGRSDMGVNRARIERWISLDSGSKLRNNPAAASRRGGLPSGRRWPS